MVDYYAEQTCKYPIACEKCCRESLKYQHRSAEITYGRDKIELINNEYRLYNIYKIVRVFLENIFSSLRQIFCIEKLAF